MSAPHIADRRLTSSVAMATYNGAEFLREQLDSIIDGSVPPDEIIICDDQSSDETAAVVRGVAQRTEVPIRFIVNEHRLGSTDNFARAISLCTGDVIFLSDQDDVWRHDKLAQMIALFSDLDVGGVFSDAELVAADRSPLGSTMFQQLPFHPSHVERLHSGEAVEIIMNRAFVTGAAFAFRRTLVPLILPVPRSDFFIHDRWIAIVAASVSTLQAIAEPLIAYRQHAGQQLGGPQKWRSAAREAKSAKSAFDGTLKGRLRFYREVEQLLVERVGTGELREDFREMLKLGVEHLEVRVALPAGYLARVRPIWRELSTGRYDRFSTGLRSALKDLVERR